MPKVESRMSQTLVILGYIAATIFFTVSGQLLVKWGMLAIGSVPSDPDQMARFVVRVFTNWAVVGGLVCAVVASFFWILTMSKSEISFAYPFMGLAIVLVLALSPLLFHESVPTMRWLGVLVVCLGIIIASRG